MSWKYDTDAIVVLWIIGGFVTAVADSNDRQPEALVGQSVRTDAIIRCPERHFKAVAWFQFLFVHAFSSLNIWQKSMLQDRFYLGARRENTDYRLQFDSSD